jgi:hypothetical protein
MTTSHLVPLACILLGACAGPAERDARELERPRVYSTGVHLSRKIVLTPQAPRDRHVHIALLRVKGDGAAVIHVDSTGETLRAKPGEYFLGEHQPPYNVRTFGEHGLYLATSDPATQTAVLVRNWVEP